MDIPLQISFRNLDRSDSIEARVRERVERLEKRYGRLTSCRVMVEAPERRHHKGKLYHVRIEMGVPGKELVVSRHPGKKHAHEDVYVAVRDAFNAAERQLEDHSRKVAGKVKTHEAPLHGKVSRLFSDDGYGFVTLSDGQEIYFHRNSVVAEAFKNLTVGAEVRLSIIEGESDKGPQATTVQPIGKHHIVE